MPETVAAPASETETGYATDKTGVAEPELEPGAESAPEADLTYESCPPAVGGEADAFSRGGYAPLPKGRRTAAAVLAVVLTLAVLSGGAYVLGFRDQIASLEWLHVENVTTSPDDATIPMFIPIDPAEFASAAPDEIISVPDETGFALPPDESENQVEIPATPINYYASAAHVSNLFTRAMQDESYIYFLPFSGSYTQPASLMRMPVSGGKPESVSNANARTSGIYSFTLYNRNLITCEYDSGASAYAFYRVPKSGENAQLLFEYDSPAFMTVYDGKLFLLFASARKLGIYDPEADSQPAFLNLPPLDDAEYIDAFSVMNGYLYYGISRNGGEDTDYLRRSLYTGETLPVFSPEPSEEMWVSGVCWDDAGNCYYGQRDPETGTYNLKSLKHDASPEILNSFELDGSALPLIALDGGDLIAQATSEILGRYKLEDWGAVVEIKPQDAPYAVTKDFLIAGNGYYKLSDLSYTAFTAAP